ncbi:hypothetical protein QUB40_07105 [Microcoleus sp. AT9_A2]|uniref:hypothetical protein n=1 Tax=Microcoleus sp. AT9_A2 TaxID=2818624 RepID=UPI002FCFB721
MNTALLIAWAIAGWCGTIPISVLIRELRRRFPPPPPPPDPFREIAFRLSGVAGGIAGGFLYSSAFPMQSLDAVNVGVTAFGAFLSGMLASDLAGLAMRQGDPTPQLNVK